MGLISNGSTIFDNGSMASGFGGSMVFIKKLTASSSATLSFVDGTDGVVLDDTYKEYVFTFNNIHPATDGAFFQFQSSTDGGSNYGITITSTAFVSYHDEADSDTDLAYYASRDLAQSTAYQILSRIGNDADQTGCGSLQLFNPSSTTFVKHFIARTSTYINANYEEDQYFGGYFNTTTALNAIQFKMDSGNIDAGDICLYGIA